jgi:hypothetical protein
LDSAIDPATNSQQVNIAPLAATEPAFDWNRDVLPILGPIILFGGIAIGLFVVAPLIYVYDLIAGVLGLPTFTEWQLGQAGASIASDDATATTAATLTSDSPLSEPAPVISAKEGPAEPAPAIETGTKDDSPPEASTKSTNANAQMSTDTATSTDTPTRTEQLPATEPAAGHEQTSTDTSAATKDLTVITKADEPSAEPKAVGAHKPSAGASTSESAKPLVRPMVPRRVVGGSLGMVEKSRDLPHRRNGAEPTTNTGPTGEKAATTGGNPSGGDSSDGDAGDS